MKTPAIVISFVLMTLGGVHAAHADSMPQLAIQKFSLSTLDTVSREIVTGQIMANIPPGFNGEIRLVWASERYKEAAVALRRDLIKRNVDPYRIHLIHDMGGYSESGEAGVQIILQQIALRLPECQDKSQSYRFKEYGEQGCAVNNLRSRALANPLDFIF